MQRGGVRGGFSGDLLVMGGADGTIRMFAWPEMNLIATVKDAHSGWLTPNLYPLNPAPCLI